MINIKNIQDITIRRALAGLDLEGYKFIQKDNKDQKIEYHLKDVSGGARCGKCNSDRLLSKGFSKCSYRHFVESGKKSYIVLHKRKSLCYACGSTVLNKANLTYDKGRFTQIYADYLSNRITSENVSLFEIARTELIPLTTIRSFKRS